MFWWKVLRSAKISEKYLGSDKINDTARSLCYVLNALKIEYELPSRKSERSGGGSSFPVIKKPFPQGDALGDLIKNIAAAFRPPPVMTAKRETLMWWNILRGADIPKSHLGSVKQLRRLISILERLCKELGLLALRPDGRPVKAQDLNRAAVVPGVFFPVLAAAPSQEQKAAVVTMLKERYENDDETKESDMGRGADEAAGQR
mmetsp:Transcript_37455/g.60142  ORF Transcript_37455/g.60142 Transcript_37455/m.60142 type:complete len:203 (+) Transcript_37455:405-1013(+)